MSTAEKLYQEALKYRDAKDYVQAFKLFRQAGEMGHASAQYHVGLYYASGRGVTQDYKQAAEWYRKAAEQGHASAMNNLGNLYSNGRGVPQDDSQAFMWQEKAAKLNEVKAQYNVGWAYENGRGVTKNYDRALEWYTKSAQQGDRDAQYKVGYFYRHAYGTVRDYKKGAEWYLKAAEQGHPTAQNNIGNCYLNGEGVEQSDELAFRWFERSANQGSRLGQSNVGYCYEFGRYVAKDYGKAFEWYRKAAEQGDAYSQNKLGYFYSNGRGVAQDVQKAFEWYRKAAEQGHALAMSNLGNMYSKGRGVAQSDETAYEWYEKAAHKGSPSGQYNMGWCYEYGRGVEKDYAMAFLWYEKNAESGDKDGEFKLGYFYFNGLGVPQDYDKAVEWYRKAAAKNHVAAISNLGFCYERGNGVPEDKWKALELYEKAAGMGNEVAKKNFEILSKQLSGSTPPKKEEPKKEEPKKEIPQDDVPKKDEPKKDDPKKDDEDRPKVTKGDPFKDFFKGGGKTPEKDGKTPESGSKPEDKKPEVTSKPEDPGKDEVHESSSMEELMSLIGLAGVKREVQQTISHVKVQKMREQMGMKPIPTSRHLVFTGNPGTGKTTVARIMAGLYKEIGVLSKGHLVEVERGDLVGEYVGATAPKTLAKIKEAMGGVLFIDEAYNLSGKGEKDYGPEAVDTLIKAMEDHRDDFVVIVAGYTEPMKKFIESNPGLESRFKTFLHFPDYNAGELTQIFESLCSKYGLVLTPEAAAAARSHIKDMEAAKDDNFGNARDVRNFFENVLMRQATRLAEQTDVTEESVKTITGEDILPFYHEEQSEISPMEELQALVGLENVKREVQSTVGLVKMQKMREERGLKSVHTSRHMVFTGNPGTGKTTVARIIGRLYKEAGILPKGHLVEVARGDLVGTHVGQTAPKTLEKIKEALGGVLFIDEAYSLAGRGENDFGQEVIDTLLKEMEDHRDNLVVIVAGYNEPMRTFIKSNPGLESRFNKYVDFPDFSVEELVKIFYSMCGKYGLELTEGAAAAVQRYMEELESNKGDNFGNARDVRNFFEKVLERQAGRVGFMTEIKDTDLLTVLEEDIIPYTPKKPEKKMGKIGFH